MAKKYIDAERLRAKIEKYLTYDNSIDTAFYIGRRDAERSVLALIDSLQQEQSEVDLKKEIKEWADLMVGASFPEQDGDFISEEDYRSVIRQTAIHFLGLKAKEENK